jgi:GNAT superfamily N-acetyltransferase
MPPSTCPELRPMREEDLDAVVWLYAQAEGGNALDQEPGASRDDYRDAFRAIAGDPDNGVWVAEVDGVVRGTLQLTTTRYVANRGAPVLWVEHVHVDARTRSRGIGEAMMRFAIAEGRRRGCLRVQLTSGKVRTRAHRFYERLGFVATHEGFKLAL